MAHGDRKHFGKGTSGKGWGAGAMTDLDPDMIGENVVLSNRDKKQHSKERSQDGADVRNEQYQDHSGRHRSSGRQG
jgi:hypothetical protein